jgi:hypothetical protein
MSFHEKSVALHLALRENCSSFALSPLSFVDYQHSRMKRKTMKKGHKDIIILTITLIILES